MGIDHSYAQEKLEALLRDLPGYNAAEFWRQMSRIASGATHSDHAEEIAKERDELSRDLEAERHHRRAAEESEQAFAAHVDRLHRAVESCMSDDERKFVFSPDDIKELESVLESRFSQSLAQRDARMKVEALEEWMAVSGPEFDGPAYLHMVSWVEHLRRQANSGDA